MEIIKKPKAPFEKYLRIKIIKAKDGYAKVKMPYRKEFTNPHGSIHGGAIASLADTAMAVAIFSKYLHSGNSPRSTSEVEGKLNISKVSLWKCSGMQKSPIVLQNNKN